MKKLGFGCMRLPVNAKDKNEIDQQLLNMMIDRYMEAGFTYFDTAHGYMGGHSEEAVRRGLVERYPRDAYILADKLTDRFFQTADDILPLFQRQLDAVGVTYFDYYLMHAMMESRYEKYVACDAFTIARELKRQGKIRHIGVSFHDKPEVLERILTEQPDIDVVQIQLNYVDYDSPSIQSGAVYEVCKKYNKPVIVMEPVKGGALAQLEPAAEQALVGSSGQSAASYAIRYAASFENVFMVLSGMSSLSQVEDNISFMKVFHPLCEEEYKRIDEVKAILRQQNMIACTACQYCVEGCPRHILIPDLFACLNAKTVHNDPNAAFYYDVHTASHGKASECIACRQCERACPQHLPIVSYLKKVTETFENN